MSVSAAASELTRDDLPGTLLEASHGSDAISIPLGTSLDALEREAIQQTLAQHDGKRTRAAADLGIPVRTLQRKLKAWGLDGHDAE